MCKRNNGIRTDHILLLSIPNKGTDPPRESYRLPHPPVSEATSERIPVHHLCHQTGTFLDAFTLYSISVYVCLALIRSTPCIYGLSFCFCLVCPTIHIVLQHSVINTISLLSVDGPRSSRALSSYKHGTYGRFSVCSPTPPLPTHAHRAAHVWKQRPQQPHGYAQHRLQP